MASPKTIQEAEMEGLTEGRIVHYVMDNHEHRPAIVVKVHDKETGVVNLHVFTDISDGPGPVRPQTSVPYFEVEGENDPLIVGSWHWIERA